MKIKKVSSTYNTYSVEMSFGQLEAIRNAMANDHADPLADELYAELTWYLDNIPGPGESEEDLKAAEEAEESGLADKDVGEKPTKERADDYLPSPGEDEGAPGGAEGEVPLPPGAAGGEGGADFGGEEIAPGTPGGESPRDLLARLPAPPAA
jgi:hypothetical protein